LASFFDGVNPLSHFFRVASLEVKGPVGGDEAKGVVVTLEVDRGAGVNIREIQESEELILRAALVVREMCGPQDEPALLPGLATNNLNKVRLAIVNR